MRHRSRLGAALLAVAAVAATAAFTRAPVASAAPAQDVDEEFGKIAYASNADGDYEIYFMTLDGSRVKQLTDNDVDDFSPSWSPNGRHIVFERERKGGTEDLYILTVHTKKARPWVVSKHIDEGAPEWSPDGKWIAFRGNDGGDGADVIALTVDKKKGKIVSSQDENSTNDYPTWSPDSRELALVEYYDEGDIYIAKRCCSGGYKKRRVTTDGDYIESDLDWSPDGSCILYSRYEEETSGYDMYAVAADASRPPRRMAGGAGDQHAGSWSPDGRWLAYSSSEEGTHDLYAMASDGSDEQPLRAGTAEDEIAPDWWAEADDRPQRPDCVTPNEEPGPLPSITPPIG